MICSCNSLYLYRNRNLPFIGFRIMIPLYRSLEVGIAPSSIPVLGVLMMIPLDRSLVLKRVIVV